MRCIRLGVAVLAAGLIGGAGFSQAQVNLLNPPHHVYAPPKVKDRAPSAPAATPAAPPVDATTPAASAVSPTPPAPSSTQAAAAPAPPQR